MDVVALDSRPAQPLTPGCISLYSVCSFMRSSVIMSTTTPGAFVPGQAGTLCVQAAVGVNCADQAAAAHAAAAADVAAIADAPCKSASGAPARGAAVESGVATDVATEVHEARCPKLCLLLHCTSAHGCSDEVSILDTANFVRCLANCVCASAAD